MTINKLPFKDKHILVVDDEALLREAIIFDLKKRGGIVHEAADGVTAFEIVKKFPIDVVISDIRMPHGDGVGLLNNIRMLNPKFPVVLLITGYADLTEAQALEKGAYALLDKPINRNKMLELVTQALGAL